MPALTPSPPGLAAAALFLPLGLALPAGAESINVVVIGSTVGGATDGDPVPGGDGYFFAPSAAAINNAGTLGFQSDLTATMGSSNTGMFRSANGVPETVARQGDPMPDFNGNLPGLVLGPLLNEAGDIVFGATLANTLNGFDDAAVILRYPAAGGDPITVVRGGQSPPVGDGVFGGISGALTPKDANAMGDVAFIAALSNTIQFTGLYRGDGTDLVQIARQGDPAPIKGATFSSLGQSIVDMNETGDVAFTANLFGSASIGVFIGDGADIQTIATGGDMAPSGGEVVAFLDMALNESGDVGMLAVISDGGVFKRQVYRGNGGALTPIMERGDLLPTPPGLFLDASLVGPSIDMNDSGAAVFQADLTGTARGEDDNSGIFVGDGTTMREVVREGAVPPGGGNREFDRFGPPIINSQGQVAFVAFLREPGGPFVDELGLFWWDPDAGLREVIREGDPIADGNLSGSLFLFADGTTSPAIRGLNDDGTVAFTFFSSAAGIATWLPPSSCAGDLDGNGSVGFADLQLLLQAWGLTGPANIDCSGTVGFNDLSILLNAWGACPE